MKSIATYIIALLIGSACLAQVGINNTNPKALLDIKASSMTAPGTSDGILIPRLDEFSTIEPNTFQNGMLVFLTGNGAPAKGFYYWDAVLSKWIPLNKPRHYVGEFFGGGIIYFVDTDGQHGLIVSLTDLGSGVAWGLYGVDVNNCESFMDGATNTSSILAAGGLPSEAAGLCASYSNGGYTDWYLPSVMELRQFEPAILTINPILEQDGNPLTIPIDIGGTTSNSGFYWSSTEGNASFARNHSFTYFNTNSSQKWQTINRVRAIRSF